MHRFSFRKVRIHHSYQQGSCAAVELTAVSLSDHIHSSVYCSCQSGSLFLTAGANLAIIRQESCVVVLNRRESQFALNSKQLVKDSLLCIAFKRSNAPIKEVFIRNIISLILFFLNLNLAAPPTCACGRNGSDVEKVWLAITLDLHVQVTVAFLQVVEWKEVWLMLSNVILPPPARRSVDRW